MLIIYNVVKDNLVVYFCERIFVFKVVGLNGVNIGKGCVIVIL